MARGEQGAAPLSHQDFEADRNCSRAGKKKIDRERGLAREPPTAHSPNGFIRLLESTDRSEKKTRKPSAKDVRDEIGPRISLAPVGQTLARYELSFAEN